MYERILKATDKQSYFLFGPRGTGKSSWLKLHYPDSSYIDLLDDDIFNQLLGHPKKLIDYINNRKKFVIIDEVQKIPKLLDEVHRLIEKEKIKFILTGSSSRKLKGQAINMLAGRALTYQLYPLTAYELGDDFILKERIHHGMLPLAITGDDPAKFLQSYVRTYLKEEVQYERLVRNISNFSRFLQSASFSQGSPLNVSNVARDCSVERKVVEDYFSILRDLLLSIELPVFTRRAKRELINKTKFYFFDCGVFKTLRPLGPLDSDAEVNGLCLETLVLQEVRALNDYFNLGYEIFYWHTRKHLEVDFVLYGEKGLIAIEVKSSSKLKNDYFDSLQEFHHDYPMAKLLMVYGGNEEYTFKNVRCIPAIQFFKNCLHYLK